MFWLRLILSFIIINLYVGGMELQNNMNGKKRKNNWESLTTKPLITLYMLSLI